jgi:hypothetical protein
MNRRKDFVAEQPDGAGGIVAKTDDTPFEEYPIP